MTTPQFDVFKFGIPFCVLEIHSVPFCQSQRVCARGIPHNDTSVLGLK